VVPEQQLTGITMDRQVYINFTKTFGDNKIQPAEPIPWSDVVNLFSHHIITTEIKAKLMCFGGCEIRRLDDPTVSLGKDNGLFDPKVADRYVRKIKENVIGYSMLVLDYDDDQMPLDKVQEVFGEYEYICYTSYHHQGFKTDKKTGERKQCGDRFRVMLPFVTDCSVEDWVKIKHSIIQFATANGVYKVDTLTTNISRFFVMPYVRPEDSSKAQIWHNTGKWVDWQDFEQLDIEEQKKFDATTGKALSTEERQSGEIDHDTLVEVEDFGLVRFGDVSFQMENVLCPFHGDINGSEVIFINRYTGHPQLWCSSCGSGNGKLYKLKEEDQNQAFVDGLNKLGARSKTAEQIEQIQQARQAKIEAEVLQETPAVVIDPDYITKDSGRYLSFNYREQHEPDKFYVDIYNEEYKELFIKSPKGTGKTHLIVKIVEEAQAKGKNVVMFGHRRNLLKNLSMRTGLRYYQDFTGAEEHSAYCLDSIGRFRDTHVPPDVVIIDEVEQVLAHLESKTLEDSKGEVFGLFRGMLRSAERIVVCDADISFEGAVEIIDRLRGGLKRPHIFVNEYQLEDKEYNLYESHYQLVQEMAEALNDGKKVFCATDSKKLSVMLKLVIQDVSEDIRTLLINADTADKKDVQAYIVDPKEEMTKYDLVIASPSLNTGVSIEGKYYDMVVGLFLNVQKMKRSKFNIPIYSATDMDQALWRVRECDDIRVFVKDSMEFFDMDEKVEIQSVKNNEIRVNKMLSIGEDPSYTVAEEDYAFTYARLRAKSLADRSEVELAFVRYVQSTGVTVNYIDVDTEKHELGKSLLSHLQNRVYDEQARVILQAEDIDKDECQYLRDKAEMTAEEYASIIKYSVTQFYGQMNYETVISWLKNDEIAMFRKAKYSALSELAANRHDFRERGKSKKMFTDYHNSSIGIRIYKDTVNGIMGVNFTEVLEIANALNEQEKVLIRMRAEGGNSSTEYREASKYRTELFKSLWISDSTMDQVFEYITSNSELVRDYFGARIKASNQKAKVAAVRGFLENFGISITKSMRKVKDERFPQWHFDYKKVKAMALKYDDLRDEVAKMDSDAVEFIDDDKEFYHLAQEQKRRAELESAAELKKHNMSVQDLDDALLRLGKL
jgi:hypothetical protein